MSRYAIGRCANTLTIAGSADDIIAIMIVLRGREDMQHNDYTTDSHRPFALNALLPIPEKIKGTAAAPYWTKDNWGVKYGAWDVLLESYMGQLAYTFTTFGGPPQVWVRTLSERFPDVQIQLDYEESYYPYAKGEFLYQDGKYLRSLVTVMTGDEKNGNFASRKVMVNRGALV